MFIASARPEAVRQAKAVANVAAAGAVRVAVDAVASAAVAATILTTVRRAMVNVGNDVYLRQRK